MPPKQVACWKLAAPSLIACSGRGGADLRILIRSDAEGLRGRALGKGADIIVDVGSER